jgi:hypothetical protein
MSGQPSCKRSRAVCAGFLVAAIASPLGALPAPAATHKRAPPIVHHAHQAYARYRGPQFAHPASLPYGPEYGFLSHVPANAIRMPGYTFVPGVGILGASCDLPTSACPNGYRDIR